MVEDVSVGEDRNGDCFLDCFYLVPVGESLRWKSKLRNKRVEIVKWTDGVVPSLFPYATVTGEDLCPSSLEHFGVFDRLLGSRENPELCCHGDR